MEYNLTLNQAKRFLLLKHGLLGEKRYRECADILKFVDSVGCIQYDPVDVIGKNPELVLQSRFVNFKREYLYQELYENRTLIDYWDKNMSIITKSDFKYFGRIRDKFKGRIKGIEEVSKLAPVVLEKLSEVDYLSSKDIELRGKMDWYWFNTRKSKAVLEALFYQGRVMIHHRKGTNRYFSLPNKLFKEDVYQDFRFDNDLYYYTFRVFRRIKGVGLLGQGASYAYIAIDGLNQKLKKQIFDRLYNEGRIIKVNIESFANPYYLVTEDLGYLNQAISDEKLLKRLEFIAPLDNLIWDRVFIKKLFNFDYTWEIYFPKEKRVYGYYTLPILYGTEFIGRLEAIANRSKKILEVKNIHLEDNIKVTAKLKKDMNAALIRLMEFNDLNKIDYIDKFWEI